ncbi:MAG: alpha/beta hydrolase [Bacillota bacterium]
MRRSMVSRLISGMFILLLSLTAGCAKQTLFSDKDIDYSADLSAYKTMPPQLSYCQDIVYDGKNKLDICYPNAEEGKRYPLLVFIHGGGWVSGDKSEVREAMPSIAMKGYIVASVEYTFADKNIFPVQLKNIRDALAFLVKNSDQYAIDSSAIGLWGISAGAHLAMLAAYAGDLIPTQGWDNTIRISAVSEWSGPTDLSLPIDPYSTVETLLGITDSTSQSSLDLLRIGSPVTYVNAYTPPTQIVHGEQDAVVSVEHAKTLASLLKKNHVQYEVCLIQNAGHSYGEDTGIQLNNMVRFFNRHLKGVS